MDSHNLKSLGYLLSLVQVGSLIGYFIIQRFIVAGPDGQIAVQRDFYKNSFTNQYRSQSQQNNLYDYVYGPYQSAALMALVAFPLMMSGCRKFAWSSIVMSFLITTIVMIMNNLWLCLILNISTGSNDEWDVKIEVIYINLCSAVSIIISMGASMGRLTPIQVGVMAIMESLFWCIMFAINTVKNYSDTGMSMVVFCFGSIFGAIVSLLNFDQLKEQKNRKDIKYTHTSSIPVLIGTILCWALLPDWQTVAAKIELQHRMQIHITFALIGSTVMTFMLQLLINEQVRIDKFIQSTISGAVFIGGSAVMITNPSLAFIYGMIGGLLSVLGFLIDDKLKGLGYHDTYGSLYTFGIPGLLGGVLNLIYTPLTTFSVFGISQWNIWGSLQPYQDTGKTQKSFDQQISDQTFCFISTIVIAIIGGIVTGLVLKNLNNAPEIYYYDEIYFQNTNFKEEEQEGEVVQVFPALRKNYSIVVRKSVLENKPKELEQNSSQFQVSQKNSNFILNQKN